MDGSVLAFDLKGLLALAERTQCVIELVPEVGDFIAQGDPLFRIYQGGAEISDAKLRNPSPSAQNARWNRTRCFRFASWST